MSLAVGSDGDEAAQAVHAPRTPERRDGPRRGPPPQLYGC